MSTPNLTPAIDMSDDYALVQFGARYWQPDEVGTYRAAADNLYDYVTHIGPAEFELDRGDMVFFLSDDKTLAIRTRGGDGVHIKSKHFAVVIRGYMPDSAIRHLNQNGTNLPYVNGCSTKQLFAPERAGDPTFQQLLIPPFSAEQAHHIHSTVRVVYIVSGLGVSIVGMEGKEVRTELKPGMVAILEPMCPHHFETPQGRALVCLPVHVFSSTGAAEFNHPMFSGTHLMNQGG